MEEENVVGGEYGLLEYLDLLGADNGADFNDGVNGYFRWSIDDDILTVAWEPWDYTTEKLGTLVERKWRLVPETN